MNPIPASRDHRTVRRLAAAAFGVGALALLGGGLAATSAAWTDTVYLSAAGTAATANLQGSIDGGATWKESTSAGAVELVIPAITALTPGDAVDKAFQIRNTGTAAVTLASTIATTGNLFAGGTPGPATAALSPAMPTTIAAGATITGTLHVAAPAWTGTTHMGDGGTVTITVNGTVN